MEQQLKEVIFVFEDGTRRVLKGEELEIWEVICSAHSDYLLPGASDHVLAEGYGGIIRGFVPRIATERTLKQVARRKE